MPVTLKVDNFPILDTSTPLPAHEWINVRFVNSSNVEWVGWAHSAPLMLVKYKSSGRIYGYIGVSRQRAVAAAYYPSTGRYVNRRIKGHFKSVLINV